MVDDTLVAETHLSMQWQVFLAEHSYRHVRNSTDEELIQLSTNNYNPRCCVAPHDVTYAGNINNPAGPIKSDGDITVKRLTLQRLEAL